MKLQGDRNKKQQHTLRICYKPAKTSECENFALEEGLAYGALQPPGQTAVLFFHSTLFRIEGNVYKAVVSLNADEGDHMFVWSVSKKHQSEAEWKAVSSDFSLPFSQHFRLRRIVSLNHFGQKWLPVTFLEQDVLKIFQFEA